MKKHNYLPKLFRAAKREVKDKGLHFAHIYHDEWCEFNKGGICNCDPDIVIEKFNDKRNMK